MKHRWLFAALLAAMLLSRLPARAGDMRDPQTRARANALLHQNEPQRKWLQVHWAENAAAAVAQAEAEHRPILVFIVVGKDGKKHAPQC